MLFTPNPFVLSTNNICLCIFVYFFFYFWFYDRTISKKFASFLSRHSVCRPCVSSVFRCPGYVKVKQQQQQIVERRKKVKWKFQKKNENVKVSVCESNHVLTHNVVWMRTNLLKIWMINQVCVSVSDCDSSEKCFRCGVGCFSRKQGKRAKLMQII